jgi:hypothetical protein
MGPLDVRYFWNTIWVILGRMRHSLDHCANRTYARVAERPLLYQGIGGELSL